MPRGALADTVPDTHREPQTQQKGSAALDVYGLAPFIRTTDSLAFIRMNALSFERMTEDAGNNRRGTDVARQQALPRPAAAFERRT